MSGQLDAAVAAWLRRAGADGLLPWPPTRVESVVIAAAKAGGLVQFHWHERIGLSCYRRTPAGEAAVAGAPTLPLESAA